MSRLRAFRRMFCVMLALVICTGPLAVESVAQEEQLSAEEQREKLTAERFFTVLLRRPNQGTSLDRVFGYHIARGDLAEFVEGLKAKAEASTDDDQAGRYQMVIGLLQLQRGEDAAAVKALQFAESKLPENASASYHLGQALLLIGRADDAAAAMKRAIDRKPAKTEYLKVAGALGRLYQRSGKTDQALEIWTDLEETFPGDVSVRQRIARILLEEGDSEGALARFDALATQARTPNDKIVFALRAAELRIRSGQKQRAITDLENLISRLRPGSYLHDEARRKIESAFLATGDYAGLASYYESWIEKHPQDVGAIVRLARTLSVQGRTPEAIEWFEKAIELSPSEPAPRLALIDAYVGAEQYADAATQFEEISKLDPDNPDHLVRWGQVLLEDTKTKMPERKNAAAQVWGKLAEARSDDAVIQSQVADLLRGIEFVDQSLDGYRKAVKLAPTEPQYKEYLGEYLYRLDRKDEALKVWMSLAEGELRTRENLVRLAEVLHQFERTDEAMEAMAEACQMDPTIDQRLRYADWLSQEEQYEQAIQQVALAAEVSESFDDRERVFAAEVKTYQASGQLDQRIERARTEAKEDAESSEPWRRLAVLHNVAGETREANLAIEKALEIDPDSIEALAIAARMYEDSGRLRQAIEKRIRLAETDQRFQTGHLQKLASLYLQTGQADQSMDVGKRLLASSNGAVESYRFYADLCGKVGKTDLRLDALRRCARMNPRSEDAQRMLADQLAEDFKTDQAIELYWRMLDNTDEIEDRRQMVGKLADLYLRTNRLDQLISRLEIRGRESGDRRTTVDLIATAHAQAGDVGLARQALESLLQESGRDTMLLERLVLLAEQSGEYDEAVRLQRDLTRLAPERKNEARLASLLLEIGAMDEAQALWLRLTESQTDPASVGRNINRLFAAGESKTAMRLVQRVLEQDPQDWEAWLKLMLLQADDGDWKSASASAEKLLALNLDDKKLPRGSKPYTRTTQVQGRTYTQPPLRYQRVNSMYSFYQMIDERYGYQNVTSLPKPMDYGQAKLVAMYCQFKQRHLDGEKIQEDIKKLETTALAEDATKDQVWQWYYAAGLTDGILQTSAINWQDPSTWKPLWRLAEVDPDAGEVVLAQMLQNRSQYISRSDLQMSKMSDQQLDWLKKRSESKESESSFIQLYGSRFLWSQFYGTELRISGRDDEADEYLKQYVESLTNDPDARNLAVAVQQTSQYATDEQLWPLIENALKNPDSTFARSTYALPAYMLSAFTNTKRIEDDLSKGAADPEYRQRVYYLLQQLIKAQAEAPLRRRVIQLTAVGGPRNSYQMVGNTYQQISIEFPPKGIGPDDQFVQAQNSAWKLLKDHTSEWLETLAKQSTQDQSPIHRIWQNIASVTLLQWETRTDEAIGLLNETAELAANEVPQMEAELRLMLADLLLRQDRKREALEAIDSLSVYDQQTMGLREFAAARLAAALGDRKRAQTAAQLLYGVRLNTAAQIELAKLMRSLDMRDMASDLVRRMRSRGGSNTDQLQSLMTYFVAQKDMEQASQVAMDLLRRSAPNRRPSSRYTTTNQARRRSALQTLASAGRLSDLIKATEKRHENSPNSQRLRAELAEMYDAAGQKNKSIALLSGTDLEKVNSVQALQATAKQFVAAGKMDQACDAYLKFLRRKQDTFSNDFYDIKRPFEQQNRLGDLADLMLEVGLPKFTEYRVAEICEDLIRNDNENIEKARALFRGMLKLPANNTNSMYAMSNVMGSASKLLTDQDLIKETAQYLIDASTSSRGWNTLFSGYSTGSDGRHNNVTTYFVRKLASDDSHRKLVESMLRKHLDENDDWHEGQVWLGMVYAAGKNYDQAKEMLEPVISNEMDPKPTRNMLWLVGSYIDTHPPLQKFSERLYEFALKETTEDRSSSEFKYSIQGRVCKFMASIGNNQRARDMAILAMEEEKKNPRRRSSNDEYNAYRQIESTMGMMEFLSEIEFPSDALRMAREFDRSLFAKAGRYASNRKERFEQLESGLLEKVREQGGLATVRSMINPSTKKRSAIDFGVTFGNRPFTGEGFSSLWEELLAQAVASEKGSDALSTLSEELEQLASDRADDDSAQAAFAFLADELGDRDPLRALIERWTEAFKQKSEIEDPNFRRQLLMLALIRLDRVGQESAQQRKADRDRVVNTPLELATGDDGAYACYLLAELGKQALERQDRKLAEILWSSAAVAKSGKWLLLDLCHAAANAEMKPLCAKAFAMAVDAPVGPDLTQKVAQSIVGSLGQLLKGAQASSSSTSSTRSNTAELDSEDVRLARRILELDQVWREKNLYTGLFYEPLVALTLYNNAGGPKAYCIPFEIKNTDNIVVQSVFGQLATRAHWSKRTDVLLQHLSGRDATTHLFATLTLLLDERGDEAKVRLAEIDPTDFKSMPKELVLQCLLAAVENPACKEQAIRLGQAFVDQNRPTQRYANIEPFETFSLTLAKAAMESDLDQQLVATSIKDYLELCEHDNDRYSGGTTRFTRRISQLEKIAQLMLPKGHIDDALTYLAMRQDLFDQGFDRSNDWVGCWALESIQAMSDRAAAYQKLADWTFQGDGAVRRLQLLARREPLPNWIPPEQAGWYPPFPPVADRRLPIASNFYSLAKLALQSNNVDDLLSRLEQAGAKKRAGVEVATAVVLATLERPIDGKLISAIENELKSIEPADEKPRSRAPLIAMQLASILAGQKEYQPFAKRVNQAMFAHTEQRSREYLLPWLSRFEFSNGWAETSTWQSADQLKHWTRSTNASAKDYAEGMTPSIWVTDGKDQFAHVCGFGNDMMWFRYPLQGSYSIEFECGDRDWKEANVAASGLRLCAYGYGSYVDVRPLAGNDWVRIPTKAMGDPTPNQIKLTMDEKFMSYFVNGQLVYREQRRNEDPWVGLFSDGQKRLSISKIKLSGEPSIPDEVNMLPKDSLRGWSGRYMNVSLPAVGINATKRDKKASSAPRRYRTQPKADRIGNLNWTVKNGELISGNASRRGGFQAQSVIQYNRPLTDGDKISYEFLYEPGKSEVHPAIGRVAYMLRNDGCKLHLMAAPNTAWTIPADFEAPVPGAESQPLQLKSGQWNQVELSRTGEQVTISVNGAVAFQGAPHSQVGDMVFGLYHNARKTSARVRNIKMTGNWPDALPDSVFEMR